MSKVEFRLSGDSYHNALIGTATKTYFGWIAGCDTASVANCSYTLTNVAFDPAGNKGTSTVVSVSVQN